MDTDARCERCKFWAADKPDIDDGLPLLDGECRPGRPDEDYTWHRTHADQWCGEFKAQHAQIKSKG